MFQKYSVRILIVGIIACLALSGTAVQAQAKTAKQSESLSKAAVDAKKQVGGVVEQLSKLLKGYNSVIDGNAKNVQSAYKKLHGDLKNTEKMIQGANKSIEGLNKEAGKFFAAWEKDLREYSNDDLKQKSMARLENSKSEYAALGKALGQARDLFAPLMASLNDQILFMGRDLSPEAIEDLKDEAAALNQQAEDVSAKVNELVASANAKSLETE